MLRLFSVEFFYLGIPPAQLRMGDVRILAVADLLAHSVAPID
jgi:hypothetical protein